MEINAGLSGSWHDPATDGQGLLVDVVVDQSNLFAAWFTFSDAAPVADAADHQRWYTVFGGYSGDTAELTLYRATGGQLNTPGAVSNEPVGEATLMFHSCTRATFAYLLEDPSVSGTIELERLSPDVFCQDIVDRSPVPIPGLNLPPVVSSVRLADSGSALNISFFLADPEGDPMDIQVNIIGPGGERYRVPEAFLDGSAGYPVSQSGEKSVVWRYAEDSGFSALSWSMVEVEVIADDRFVANVQEIIDLVRTDRMVADVEFMQGERHHAIAPAHLEATREYLLAQITARGLPVERQDFDWFGAQGANIIATLESTQDNDDVYIVDGHFDTVIWSPGADDNASGTAGMLEAMRVLSQFNSEVSIRFIGFDQEENGSLGSKYYATNLHPEDNVLGVINFEMIGYTCREQPECVDLPFADTAIYNVSSESATAMSDAFVSAAATHVPGLKIISLADDDNRDYYRSDHASFWSIGVDAVMLTDGANYRNPHYHEGSDLIDHFDLEFMTQVVQAAVGTLVNVAGVTHTGKARSRIITLD